MHVLSNHYYMPSGTFFFESRSSVTQCGTAVILMTLNEKGIWKKTRMSSRCAIFHREKCPAAARGLRECPPADGRQMYDDESGGTPVSGSAGVRKLQRGIFSRERKIVIPPHRRERRNEARGHLSRTVRFPSWSSRRGKSRANTEPINDAASPPFETLIKST